MKQELKDIFYKVYGERQVSYFFSPGRVNLIGEHTDYNGGHVFPSTISLGTYGVVSSNEDMIIRCYSDNYPALGIVEVDLNDLSFSESDEWVNYLKGVIIQFKKKGFELNHGFDLAIKGNIPGGGLSSSASLELLVCVMLRKVYGFDLDMLEMVKMSRAVENEYIGVNCGIMDQFIIGMGKKDHAILLDTNTLNYKHVPLELGDYVILIGNTNKKRTLADSKYNERFSECQTALKMMQEKLDISSLGDMSIECFEENAGAITDGVLLKRARHAVYENQRTLKSYDALMAGDLIEFGRLMNESHESLKEDYEVSCKELDTMVYAMREQEGVIGSRMTGAGFGGCTVSLVKKDSVDKVISVVSEIYENEIGYKGDFHGVEIGNGAGELEA
ncbi:galactokinase [Acidaminobacter sp. JC074]|uniref:galactokinase n=1 Tax=Acidaminobacter sp. JC074 TaxID=2530199 RepID=UPI001F10916B|nr:galactokinase [Acidaminobacter sp. JC074]MCH4886816.1 galactokinase [Acidaminobacter sp. JC074]